MAVPEKLGDAVKGKENVKISFFLHTVFPSHGFFAILPQRKELLEGLLNCGLMGFRTAKYEERLRKSCQTIPCVTASSMFTASGFVTDIGTKEQQVDLRVVPPDRLFLPRLDPEDGGVVSRCFRT